MSPAPEGNALPGEASPPAPRSPRGALAGLSLAMLLSALGTSIANVSLPTLVGVFGATFQQVQWVVLAYLLAVTALIVSAGRLGDLVGRRRLLLGGIVVFTAGSVLAGAGSTLWCLIAARAVQGVGAGGLMALVQVVMARMIAPRERGRYSGYLGAVFALATVLGPLTGGIIVDTSWLDGSGPCMRPCSAAARSRSAVTTPASTTATRSNGWSSRIPRMRVVSTTRQPATADAPPDRLVPAPRGTTGTPCREAHAKATDTSWVQPATNAASGSPPATARVWSWR